MTLVLVGVLSAAAIAATGTDVGNYRTAVAETGTVTQTITTSGTVDAAQRGDVASAVAGSVRRVPVSPGDTVAGDDLLVALDRTDAERAVRKARAALAQARAELERAEDAQEEALQSAQPAATMSSAATQRATTQAVTVRPISVTLVATARASTAEPASSTQQAAEEQPLPTIDLPPLSELQALQDTVKAAQTASTTALAAASAALDAQVDACATAYGRGQIGGATGNGQVPPTETPGTPADQQANDACDAALAAVEAAQQAVSQHQTELQTALDNLTAALVVATEKTSAAVTALQDWMTQQHQADSGSEGEDVPEPSDGSSGDGGNQGSGDQGSGEQGSDAPDSGTPGSGALGSGGQGPGGGSPGGAAAGEQGAGAEGLGSGATRPEAAGPESLAAASALGVASAQAAVDRADADLIAARQDLDATGIVAQGPGTVTAVNTRVGDSVAAGDVVVTVIGDKGATVTMTLIGADPESVAVGQDAAVTLPGASASVAGEITWVSTVSSGAAGPLPFASTSTYTAFVHVPAREMREIVLPQGAPAEVAITVGSSEDAVTVPTSAVIREDSGTSVRVLEDEGPVVRAVEVGRSGGGRTEIVSGIELGEQVVLADLDADIDAASEVTTGGAGPGGGRGLPAGGGPGGAGRR